MAKKSTRKRQDAPKSTQSGVVTGKDFPSEEVKWWREAIEGLVIAVVLALLIRGFEAEAFVIPTGSMAPLLMGRHKDVICEQCNHNYRVGASYDSEVMLGDVITTNCPLCAYPQDLNYDKARDVSFTGDRILVNKFAYDLLGEPQRFDVIVFKNPGNAKQNYIKRLCGLPGETIELFRGDVYYKKDGETEFKIARKPVSKIQALLQLVHDTDHIPAVLDKLGLPPRWQPQPNASGWTSTDNSRTFKLAATDGEAWIRYRHIVASGIDWDEIKQSGTSSNLAGARAELITDHYAYNSYVNAITNSVDGRVSEQADRDFLERSTGKNWVGDLGLEVDARISSSQGNFLLDLVEGGWHFRCMLDVATGKVTLTINGGRDSFSNAPVATAETSVRGTGTHRFFFSNVDNELRLWIDGKLCQFDTETTYERPDNRSFRPVYSGEAEPGDAAPAGLGGQNIDVAVSRLRIHRDVYYVAVKNGQSPLTGDYELGYSRERIQDVLQDPEAWATSPLFDRMRNVQFDLEDFEDDSKDQFFPMGDNSPQSEDARIWRADSYVERQFLIGEAIVIYWPHPWHAKLPGSRKDGSMRTIPVFPNVSRMGIIH